jgi:apolipoprotein N-acyltransferase
VAAPAQAWSGRGAVAVRALSPRARAWAAFGLGVLLPLAFAPFGIYPLAALSLAGLFVLWEGASPRAAAGLAFRFGFGAFLVGLHWLYISLHTFGKAPLFISLPLMVALVAIMAGYLAAIGYAVNRFAPEPGVVRWLLVLPGAWTLDEWLRGWVLGGFPWLSLGYSQVDAPLAGLAPVAGVYAASFAVVLTAGALVALVRGTTRQKLVAGLAAASLWTAGLALRTVEWTEPAGEALDVALVQGAVTQDRKWLPEELEPTKALYRVLTEEHVDADIVIWPEAAVPQLLDEMGEYLAPILEDVRARGNALVFGVVEYEPSTQSYYNAVLGYDGEVARYRKRHLVPFGEFFPVPDFVRRWMRLMSLPYSDFARGGDAQPPLEILGQHIGVSICYEDAFGDELIGVLNRATLLVNVSNDAWFGGSVAPHQHLQIARMRALEAGRFLMRATNTGITALIGADGRVEKKIPQFDPGVLRGEVQPRTGLTPYARLGNWPVVMLALATFFVALVVRRTRLPGIRHAAHRS